MPRLYLVRHGHAAAGFADHADPGLDDLGREQAFAAAARLAEVPPMTLWSSPLKRALETAEPLATRWQRPVRTESRVAEIPSPPGVPLTQRSAWLGALMADRWSNLTPALHTWSQALTRCLVEQAEDGVFFSHFIAINVAVGAATGTDQVITFRPDYASITVLETDGRTLTLIERGAEASTRVN